jgi:hypothetical protein
MAPIELHDLRRTLSNVNDAELLAVVALIDGMAQRGAFDELIAPLRPRIAELRPPRPLRFARLLFLPLDSLIVAPSQFRVGTPALPRTALAPLTSEVQIALGPQARAIEAAIDGHAVADTETVQRVGEVLWPAAGAILARAPQPRGWTAAGLLSFLHKPLSRGVAAVLNQAVKMRAVVTDVAAGLPLDVEAVDTILVTAASAGPAAWSFVITALVGQLADAAAVLRHIHAWTAGRSHPALSAAFDMVSDMQIARLEQADAMPAAMVGRHLANAAVEVHRISGLLDGLDDEAAPTERRSRLEAIRTRLDASCRACFAIALASDFLAPLNGLLQAPDPEAAQQLETSARRLRALESQARRLGSIPIYEALLRKAAVLVRDVPPDRGLAPVDKAHLIEILVGPAAALALQG